MDDGSIQNGREMNSWLISIQDMKWFITNAHSFYLTTIKNKSNFKLVTIATPLITICAFAFDFIICIINFCRNSSKLQHHQSWNRLMLQPWTNCSLIFFVIHHFCSIDVFISRYSPLRRTFSNVSRPSILECGYIHFSIYTFNLLRTRKQ